MGETGAPPTLADVVRVHYQGTLADGKEFDSSLGRGRPAELPLEALVPCWKEVLQQMRPGGAVRIVCPPDRLRQSRRARPHPARQHAELRDRAARGQALRRSVPRQAVGGRSPPAPRSAASSADRAQFGDHRVVVHADQLANLLLLLVFDRAHRIDHDGDEEVEHGRRW